MRKINKGHYNRRDRNTNGYILETFSRQLYVKGLKTSYQLYYRGAVTDFYKGMHNGTDAWDKVKREKS